MAWVREGGTIAGGPRLAGGGGFKFQASATEERGMLSLSIFPRRCLRGCFSGGALVLLTTAASAAPATPPDKPVLVPADHGAQLLDQRSALVWSRCVEGMKWNGKTCTGQPTLVNHTQALALAAARKEADGFAWRLPRVPELQRLVSHADHGLGPDPVLFPAAPAEWHWAMTASLQPSTSPVNQYNYGNIVSGLTNENATQVAFLHGWAVNMTTGEARGDVLKRTELPVRLVWSLEN